MVEKNPLSDTQEMLLSKYFDDECNAFDRFRVYRLLESNLAAGTYLDQLQQARELVRNSVDHVPVSLWSRISSQLHQQEKNRFRLAPVKRSDMFPSFVRFGLSGAAVAAVVFLMAPSVKVGNVNQMIASTKQGFLGSTNPASTSLVPTAMQVDWMRSNGRVTVMPSDVGQGSAPVILIRRRQNQSAAPAPIAERNTSGIVLKDSAATSTMRMK